MKFDVILADIPWNFKTWSAKGKGKSPENHYPVMTMEEILKLRVADIAAENCALFLWGLWTHLRHVIPVMEAWGFQYSTLAFVWFKTTKTGKAHFGTGYTFRANPEPCFLGFRGSMPPAVRNERNWMAEPEVLVAQYRGHSVKPDEQYEKIERVYPNMRCLEMFARQEREGWTSIGNEIDGKDIRESLEELRLK